MTHWIPCTRNYSHLLILAKTTDENQKFLCQNWLFYKVMFMLSIDLSELSYCNNWFWLSVIITFFYCNVWEWNVIIRCSYLALCQEYFTELLYPCWLVSSFRKYIEWAQENIKFTVLRSPCKSWPSVLYVHIIYLLIWWKIPLLWALLGLKLRDTLCRLAKKRNSYTKRIRNSK